MSQQFFKENDLSQSQPGEHHSHNQVGLIQAHEYQQLVGTGFERAERGGSGAGSDYARLLGTGFEQQGDNARVIAAGFPDLRLHGDEWSQEAGHTSTGKWDEIWHGIKHVFGSNDSVEDTIRNHCLDQLTPEQRKEYEKEKEEMNRIDVTMNLNGGRLDDYLKPHPMIDKVNQMVNAEEKAIHDQVMANMSPQDRQRLEQQQKDWDAPHRYFGFGGDQDRDRKPGPMLQEYWDRVREATAERYKQAA